MKKIASIIIASALYGSVAFAQTPPAQTPPPPPFHPAPQPSLKPVSPSVVKFKEVSYNFGQVPYNSDVRHTFEFTNISKEPVAIRDVGTSCGCTTPSYSKEPVAPGQTGSVTAKYDSSRIGGFTKTLTVYINDETIRLTINGTIMPPSSENNNNKKSTK